MSCLSTMLKEHDEGLQAPIREVHQAASWLELLQAVWRVVCRVAVLILQEQLAARAQRPVDWPDCPRCGHRLQSKGWRSRRLRTLFGEIGWRRRIGRCPRGCRGSQVALLDDALGLRPQQRYGEEVAALGCRLAVFVPDETAVRLLQQLTGIAIAPGTVWNWVQRLGQRLVRDVEADLQALETGDCRGQESAPPALRGQPMVIGADGVLVPFRPHGGSPTGKTRWGEVKVAIVARLGRWVNRRGRLVTRLAQRRLVAVHGGLEALQARLWLEALRQQVCSVRQVLWLSDGGRGFWNLFARCFQRLGVIGILDFYHAAQYLAKGAKAVFDGRTQRCQATFTRWRHDLRHGHQRRLSAEIQALLASPALPKTARKTLANLQHYLHAHQAHLDYPRFKAYGWPIGSGLVESACQWLIQQRFKGVGMRWSEPGFDHLLHLRLAWINQRLDRVLPTLHPSPTV
jgi:hypothetical protein